VAAAGTDVRADGVMGVAWSHATGYKPWAPAGDSILVLSERGGDIDIVDARTGRTRTFPIGHSLTSLLPASGPMALGITQNRILALDPTGAILWSRGVSHAGSISQLAPIGGGLVLLLPTSDSGQPSPRLHALARADGELMWAVTLPPSYASAVLGRIGSSVMLWSTASGLVRWSVIDEKDGHTLAQGEESGSRLVVRGRRFIVCDEREGIVRIHPTGTETSRQLPFSGRCGEMTVDDDAVYAIRSHMDDKTGSGEARAFAMSDGSQRWTRTMPVAHGAVVHGPWLLVPSDGGVVRAVRRDTGELAWSYGVGVRGTLTAIDENTVIASGDSSIHALVSMTSLPAERSSEVTLHITSWSCVDRASTTLLVGDVPAQADGPDRFTARVQGRGHMLIRSNPWADIVRMDRERERDWAYAPLVVEIDGARHSVDVELDNCDED
jgi:outer membrane protein assembly factor BamB